jgi:hypothetical protein
LTWLSCLQTLVISSSKVGWKKQATCILEDNEPAPPKNAGYQSEKGWKMVKQIMVKHDGGDFLIPKDQLLVVTPNGYEVIKSDNKRLLSQLSPDKSYLLWYHHLLPTKEWQAKRQQA